MTLRISNVDPQGAVALALLGEAAIDVRPLYLGDAAASVPLPNNAPLGARDIYIAAWLLDVPVGCGAIRELDQSTAEIQRMYVHRDFRRKQVGRTILTHLENEARRLGYTRVLLETGDRQAPAMALYEASGFRRVPPFGKHVDDPTSVCYERFLWPETGGSMKRVTGIGGIFFKAKDAPGLQAWYKRHLGIDVQEWGGTAFTWADSEGKPVAGTTIWSVVSAPSEHFAPSSAAFMINYRVEDLHALVRVLREEGCNVLDRIDDSEYGKFAWVIDPEGNKVELWQPPAGQ